MMMTDSVELLTVPEMYNFHSSASTSDEDDQMHLGEAFRNKKLKNQLCKNFLNTGYCRYFDKCQFAHGIEELRQSQKTNLKYKTKQCQSYFVKGCCQYGVRCNFLHRRNEPESDKILKQKQIMENFIDVIVQESKIVQLVKKE